MKSTAEKKLTLPNIQPTVIKALPSSQQTLPSLRPTEKLSLPSISSKVKKAPTRLKSSVKRMLPSIPLVENVAVPCIKANVAASLSVHQLLPTLPSIRKQDALLTEKPQIKVKSAVKRLLPNISPPEKHSPPCIEPSAVKAQPNSRRQRFLPSIPTLPTIKEQQSPVLEEMEAGTVGVHTAESEQTKGVHLVESFKSKVLSLAEGNKLQSRQMKQKDNSLSDPKEAVEAPRAALQSAGEETPSNHNDELPERYRTKRNEKNKEKRKKHEKR